MFVDSNLTPEPDNKDWVLGWGVVRYAPWHLYGVYLTEAKAKQQIDLLGGEYEVHYGSHRLNSDDFIWGEVK
ncbi:TPA: hypothetical protein QH450_002032 [Providencia alcalifaciens]|uniref:Uncharacterized protein n=1 Tax=Providencia alcalifaciens TaxID=126385 RepID=A0AAW9VC95_9GAMM|nr:hypothetical protein [Providencia alcalifaciens]HEF8785119.1 hypothetical protein [Providencia alcalifaciens]